jgi:DNA polymerase-4
MEAQGLRLIGDLARASPEALFRVAGREAPRLQQLARGIDERKVTPERETKSVSTETTFESDIARREELEPILWRLAEKTAARLRKADLAGRTVTLKLKTAEFKLLTRSRQLAEPTQLAKRLYDTARDLLAAEPPGRPYRLIGIGASDLTPGQDADHGDLAAPDTPRLAARERAVEKLRDRFGAGAVVMGVGLGRDKPISGKR